MPVGTVGPGPDWSSYNRTVSERADALLKVKSDKHVTRAEKLAQFEKSIDPTLKELAPAFDDFDQEIKRKLRKPEGPPSSLGGRVFLSEYNRRGGEESSWRPLVPQGAGDRLGKDAEDWLRGMTDLEGNAARLASDVESWLKSHTEEK